MKLNSCGFTIFAPKLCSFSGSNFISLNMTITSGFATPTDAIILLLQTKAHSCVFLFVPQVCLDCTVTTEKELDTVEVLKAIQKAKEAKDRMSSSDKKVCSVTLHHTPEDRFEWFILFVFLTYSL